VYGPNGFFREIKGHAAQGAASQAETKVFYDVANGNLYLVCTNGGSASASLTVVDNAYGAASRAITVPAGASSEGLWILAASHHWYDLSVTDNNDSTFLRRAAGHIEVGRTSITDPAAVAPMMALK